MAAQFVCFMNSCHIIHAQCFHRWKRPSVLRTSASIRRRNQVFYEGAVGAAATPRCQTAGPNEEGNADNGFPHLSLWVLRSVSTGTCAAAAAAASRLLASLEMAAPVSSRFKALINHTQGGSMEGVGRGVARDFKGLSFLDSQS